MFFYAAKIVWLVLQPTMALLILLVAGLLLAWLGIARHLGAGLVVLAAIGLVVASVLPLGPILLLPLEDRFPRPADPAGPVAGIVVLGGGVDQHVGEKRGIVALTEAGDRMTEGVALALRHPEARLVFSGGSAEIISDGYTEADAARRFFRDMGVADSRITIEDQSRNTAENASETRALVAPKPGETWLLVTSAFHMPRAMGVFRAVGWDITPWPTDYRTRGPEDRWTLISQPSRGLELVDLASKEWIGLLAYRLTGRTTALLPGPEGG